MIRTYNQTIELLTNLRDAASGSMKIIYDALLWAYATARTPFAVEEILQERSVQQIEAYVAEITVQWDGRNYLNGAWQAALSMTRLNK